MRNTSTSNLMNGRSGLRHSSIIKRFWITHLEHKKWTWLLRSIGTSQKERKSHQNRDTAVPSQRQTPIRPRRTSMSSSMSPNHLSFHQDGDTAILRLPLKLQQKKSPLSSFFVLLDTNAKTTIRRLWRIISNGVARIFRATFSKLFHFYLSMRLVLTYSILLRMHRLCAPRQKSLMASQQESSNITINGWKVFKLKLILINLILQSITILSVNTNLAVSE